MGNDLPSIKAEQSLPTLYTLAHSDIRWAKERSSLSVYWMLGLQAGILALRLSSPLTVTLIAVPTIFSCLHLVDLHLFANECRGVTKKIAARMEGTADLVPNRRADENHVSYLVMHLAAICIGGAVTIIAAINR